MNRLWLLVSAIYLMSGVDGLEKKKVSSREISREALEQLLHIHPPSLANGVDRERLPEPPLYMLDLYKKYSQPEFHPPRRDYNRITSFLPINGEIHGVPVLMFNITSALSGPPGGSGIHLAEIHFYKKRQRGDHRAGYRVEAFSLTGSSLTSVGKWKIAPDAKGWQVLDVTRAVEKSASKSSQLVAFLFHRIKRSTKEYEYVKSDSVVKMEPSPFLIVFSNDSSIGTVQRNPLSAFSNGTPAAVDRSSRTVRSIDDNELPHTDIYHKQIPKTSPGILESRSTWTGRKKAPKIEPYRQSSTYHPDTRSELTLAWPQQHHHKRKKNHRRGKKKQQRKLIDSWPYNQQHVNDARFYSHEDVGKSLCQRRKLTVDFAQIGWGEWIISPKTFEAYYCAGSCPFPLTKELNPTNHATIQSIVHAIGNNPEVPAPCCVPNSLSSVTLLYFDDNMNVVLKNYPAMTADSCSCQ